MFLASKLVIYFGAPIFADFNEPKNGPFPTVVIDASATVTKGTIGNCTKSRVRVQKFVFVPKL